MVDSSRRRNRRAVMGNHNRCWIWGRNVVLETLQAGRWPILELLISDRIDRPLAEEALRQAIQWKCPATVVPEEELTKACRTGEHQGFAARMAPFPCLSLAELERSLPRSATVALLDRLQDPFNFGAILRCASTLGVDGILIGEREQVEVNSQVARSSAGAINHIPLAQTDDLPAALDAWRQRGFQAVAASEKASVPVFNVDFCRPTVIVIGNEGRGIRPELLSKCETSVSIPMSGQVGSLNAAVAAGILFYEMRRQRSLSPPAR